MEQVPRHTLIRELDEAVAGSSLVTVSAAAAGGGVSTVLGQWTRDTRRSVAFGTCSDFGPQRPLAAISHGADVTDAVRAGDWAKAADRVAGRRAGDAEPTVFVVDDADRLDEASTHLIAALMDLSCPVVLGHHHAPSTNPSLELLVDGTRTEDQSSLVVSPLSRPEARVALGEAVDPEAALEATGGNPLALSLYRGSDFTTIATAVLERFDRLPADGQGLVAILAASPEPVPFDVLEAMGRPWGAHGRHVERSGLVTVRDEAISLRHDKVRRVLYEEMTAVRRRFVHAEILDHIAASDDLTLVMHHAVGAGDVEVIITRGPSAAAEAAELGARREAVRHLENVLVYEHSLPEADRSSLREALDHHLSEAAG